MSSIQDKMMRDALHTIDTLEARVAELEGALRLSDKGLNALNNALPRRAVHEIPMHIFEKVGAGIEASRAALTAKEKDQ